MHRTYVEIHGQAPKTHEIPKPCDHFDLICGTGTGGLIAIMLGRLRLDLETCKDVYVRMTRRVFETDKTFAGIPYRSTLFKASKLEEAIKECVMEHTVFEDEGNDNLANAQPMTPMSPIMSTSIMSGPGRAPQRTVSNASRASGMSPASFRGSMRSGRWGDPNALLYDVRENRTKTAVTAVYKGTPMTGNSALLRSYDSRKEPPPEFNCAIWQAGRATSATGLAFKPIQIGQSVFIDEGAGKYNPAPQVLDEATVNEWPGREVGVFISIGTGKRPVDTNHMQQQWWESFCGNSVGDFADAKRRLFQKIEGCEATHQYMMGEHLSKRQVNPENYYRVNVEVGVGDFGMNEWNRLSDISTSTRMYLARTEVQTINLNAAAKLARIHRAKLRHDRMTGGSFADEARNSWDYPLSDEPVPTSNPMAVELPAEEVHLDHQRSNPHYLSPNPTHNHYQQVASRDDKFAVISSDDHFKTVDPNPPRHRIPPHWSAESYNTSTLEIDSQRIPRHSVELPLRRTSPPPLPPKTPLPTHYSRQQQQHQDSARTTYPIPMPSMQGGLSRPPPPSPPARIQLPYPDTDALPPPVNMARKPQYGLG